MKPPISGDGVTLMIVDIARLLRKRFELALSQVDTGLTVAESRTLAYVWRNPGLRQTMLAERMNVEPMTLVGYLDSLETAGLIARTIDPADRRAKQITLTDAADDILQKIDVVTLKVRAETLAGMTEMQCEDLEHLLGSMKENLLNRDHGRSEK
ncbi:MarR family winged helix-turn-helix transcriptional regulator [Roseibium algae]|uniref:MarR family transcriptional regulator n=1 Tax=Roseibium algae TaxID=3123038 RepID=A0ABU8TNS3_9HYPH